MITVNNLSKNFGKKVLFENISFNINKREKIGLIGPNGAGKSTFFQLILGESEPSSGSMQIVKNTRVGHLPQESSFKSDKTVLDELTKGDSLIESLRAEKRSLELENNALSPRYGEILHELEILGAFELEHKAKKILMGLGFKESDFDRPISQLSGGWQMRVLLAKLLVYQYDLLLLDEPTNYLDLNAALWLKDYLKSVDSTFIMISHDKDFLTDITNYTLVLELGKITKVSGNYEHYEAIREEQRAHLLKQFKEYEKKRQQLETFISRFHAQPNKAAAVRNKKKTLERIPAVVLPPDPRASIRDFDFPQTRKSGHRVITLEKISKSYPGIQVYKDFDFEIERGQKAVLVGDNGAGKSTLLKILAGVVNIDTGSRTVGYNVDIGYFSQTRMDILNPVNTVLDEAYNAAPGTMSQEALRTILGAFLFTGDDAEKNVSILSGGEKSRLNLAKFLINPPNFLLLDEPTTHLDVDAVDALIKALKSYQGTLVFISHDIHFVRSVANMVFEVKNGHVRKFHGGFDYYYNKRAEVPDISFNKVSADKRKRSHDASEARRRSKEEDKIRRQEERRRKTHNINVGSSIKKLSEKKDKLRLESYAKTRALSNQHIWRDEETVRTYGRRLKDIENEISEIDKEIEGLRKTLL